MKLLTRTIMTENTTGTIASFTLLTRSEGERRAAMTPEQRQAEEDKDIARMQAAQIKPAAPTKPLLHPQQWEAMQASMARQAQRKLDEERLKTLMTGYDLNFVYIRHYDELGEVSPKGGMVLAYRIPLKGGQIIEVATSICNKVDVFDKFVGKLEAAENFDAGNVVKMKIGNGTTYSRTLEQAFNFMVNS